MSKIIDDLKLQYRIGGIPNKIIYWNVGLFAVPYLLNLFLKQFNLDAFNFISLASNPAELLWKPWSLISYGFFHSGPFHILFNMLIFNFSSRLFLTYFTPKQLLSLYMTGIIFSGIIYILCYFLFPSLANLNVTLVGASGAIMSVFFAVATYNPLMEIRLMFIGNVKIWHIAFAYLILDLIQLPLENTGGHIAHLGGALFGYLFVKQIQNGTDITSWFTVLMDSISNLFSSNKNSFKKIHRNPKPVNKEKTPETSGSKIVTKDKNQQQIDEILDKIGKSGYDSLSKDEKEFLFKAGS
jgi:membrane associated rhomboid family serine protease